MSTAPNPTSSKHDGSVYFWNPDGTWQEFLSQWYACSFAEKDAAATSEGAGQDEKKTIHYRTTEMYMMYQKAVLFSDAETARKILEARTPAEQKDLGRQVKNFDSRKWNEHKVAIVTRGNRLKFSQATSSPSSGGTPLRERLLRTGDRELVEASPEDRVWGIGFSAEEAPRTPRERWGLNLLGGILEKVRRWLREGEGENL